MAKRCTYCSHMMEDHESYCPACGKTYIGVNANPSSDPHYARPINESREKRYSQPLQANQYPQPGVSQHPQAPTAPKKSVGIKPRLPYILAGFAAAAVVFTVLLLVLKPFDDHPSATKKSSHTVSSSSVPGVTTATETTAIETTAAQALAGEYTWLNGADGATGSLEIDEDGSGVFTMDGAGSVYLIFDTEDQTVSFTNANGEETTGTYVLDDTKLNITIDGYTDRFERI